MAPLSFNLLGFTFQEGLSILRASATAAADGVHQALAVAHGKARAYDDHVASGGAPRGEWNDDGVRIWEESQVLA